MKRIIILVLILAVVYSQFSFSQNGFKKFKWGMKISKIEELVPDLKNEEHGYTMSFFVAYHSKYGASVDGTILDPLKELFSSLAGYSSEEMAMKFCFVDSSLFAVEISQVATENNSFSTELSKKYGDTKSASLRNGDFEFQAKVWFPTGDRIIIFIRASDDSKYETVTYLDKKFFFKLSEPVASEQKKLNKKYKNRLD